jgi:hypothetical protein
MACSSCVKENVVDRIQLEGAQLGDFLFYETA